MIAACALYFPTEKPRFKSVLARVRSDGSLFQSPSWLEYDTANGPVRLNLKHNNLNEHLRGFKGYVACLRNSGAARSKAMALIDATKAAIGVVLPGPVEQNSAAFTSLVELLKELNGFMFVNNSIMLADGSFLVGPMADELAEYEEPPLVPVSRNDCIHLGATAGVAPDRVESREEHYRQLAERGFRCSRRLPLLRGESSVDTLRPVREIIYRLMGLKALFLWVAAAENTAPREQLEDFVERNRLAVHLTSQEQAVLVMQRSDANSAHANDIGWRLENMWALSWILGFDPAPPFYQGQLPQSITDKMLFEFLPAFDTKIEDFFARINQRSAHEVAQLEDLYYCAHNAVRSAQLGSDTLPPQFHPIRDGGATHERRQSLTWALSPDTAWDETDLST